MLDSLPLDLIGVICKYLKLYDIYSWALTCKKYYNHCRRIKNLQHLIPKSVLKIIKVPVLLSDGRIIKIEIKVCTVCGLSTNVVCCYICGHCSNINCMTKMTFLPGSNNYSSWYCNGCIDNYLLNKLVTKK